MIIDLCAGPGGWNEGLRILGRTDVVGIEKEKNARATRAAAGHYTWPEGDMTKVETVDLINTYGVIEGLIGSPPCQDFSPAGRKAGLDGLRGQLIWEPMRFIQDLAPMWVAMEEVKECLPIWRMYEEALREMGYYTWSGILNAADYGVPQKRKRAIFMAHRTRPIGQPQPTHGIEEGDDLFGFAKKPYVTMAEALGWTGREIIFDSRGDGDGGEWSRSDWWTSDKPSRTVGEKARSWVVLPPPEDCPPWPYERPATTVVGSFRPDIMAAPDFRKDPKVPRQKAPGSVPITVAQAMLLQSFAVGYPVQGARTRAFEQIGNAVPPLLAAAVLKELL